MDKIDQMFEDVRNEVLKQIFPFTWNVNDPEYHREVVFTDENWKTGKAWTDKVRVTNPMNADTRGLRKIQEALRENDGVYTTTATRELIESLKC